MSDAHLEALLAQWSRGDVAAAEQAVLACGPYLRMVIRRQMSTRFRAKFDTGDIVQSVWADLLGRLRQADWQFTDADHFRAFLIKAARNRLTDRLRQHRAAVAAECPLAGDGLDGLAATGNPRPSEVAQADDLWDRVQALCPPAHRRILDMKRQGLTLAEIAAQTGLHEGSIRRILYDLASRLALGPKPATARGAASAR